MNLRSRAFAAAGAVTAGAALAGAALLPARNPEADLSEGAPKSEPEPRSTPLEHDAADVKPTAEDLNTEPTTTSTVAVATTSTTTPLVVVEPFDVAPPELLPENAGPVDDVEWLILEAFGADGPAAVRVARCESGLRPDAVNGAHAGLFQLSATWHRERAARLGYSWSQMFDAVPNIRVARDLFLEQGWQPWTCAA